MNSTELETWVSRNDLESPAPKKQSNFVMRANLMLVCIIFIFQVVWAVIVMKIYFSGQIEEIGQTVKAVRELIVEVKQVIDPFSARSG